MLRTRVQAWETRDRIEEGEERQTSTRNPKRVIDAMRKTGETRAEGEKNGRESVGSVYADPEDLEKLRGRRKALRALIRTVERVCLLCRV